MTDTVTLPAAVRGPSSDDREAWFEQRRQGITATEVRDLAKGGFADRRRILTEKLTGERSFAGNKYTDHGNRREPIIARWITAQFEIPENTHVWARGRYLATPDGLSEDGLLFEIKTSKHDLTPGPLRAGRVLDLAKIGPRHRSLHFWSTGYYDQIQWQMFVLDASECLLAWEQHDDDWPDPKPLYEVPQHAWILRDDERIAALLEIADAFLIELDAARYAGLPPVGDVPAEVADHMHRLLAARNAEAVAKAQKETEWKWLQGRLLADGEPDLSLENADGKITVSTTTNHDLTQAVDEAALEADPRSAALVAEYDAAEAEGARIAERIAAARAALDDLRKDYTTVTTTTRTTRRLTVTAARSTSR